MDNANFKYEANPQVVQYLIAAVGAVQAASEKASRDKISILDWLRNPANLKDLEKINLETLKAKYESPIDKKEEEKKSK